MKEYFVTYRICHVFVLDDYLANKEIGGAFLSSLNEYGDVEIDGLASSCKF